MPLETMVIAGSGPAGLTAAVYAARAGIDPLVLEGDVPGGQLTVSEAVENYPGCAEALPGTELMTRFRKQARRFGVRFRPGLIRSVAKAGGHYDLQAGDEVVGARTLIIATGAQARRLGVPGEAEYYGRGVSGCAVCDGSFFEGGTVVVVGGGNTAMHDARYLARVAKRVIVVHRREHFRADACEVESARGNCRIEWLVPYVVEQVLGEGAVSGVMVRDLDTGVARRLGCDGVFVAIGHDPRTEAFRSLVETHSGGYIRVAANSTCTSAPGVFACGDVCDAVYRQAAVAAGQGCMAAMDALHYLQKGGWDAGDESSAHRE